MKYLCKWLFVILIMGSASAASASLPVSAMENGVPSLAPMLKKAVPAVVNISTTSTVRMQQNPLFRDPFFRKFFNLPPGDQQQQQQEQKRQALGSGVIIDAKKGLVVTNNHVIQNADEITVKLQDGRQFEGKLVGSDPESDVAVVRIKADNLTELPIGDSDKLQVGDFVVAIGNPFGLNQTVTSGIVSALGRTGLGIEGYEDFIQTDASINPGNSGGALINLKGDLVGINTAILAPSGGNVGIGFSIPINMVRQITEQLVAHGSVKRGRLGVYVQDLTQKLAKAFGIDKEHGAVVSQVVPNSPAEKAGLKEGDVITELDGKAVTSAAQLRNDVGLMRVGKSVNLTVMRDGKKMTVDAVLEAREQQALKGGDISDALEGATFAPVPEELKQQGVDSGVYVKSVEEGSTAWNNELRAKDVVTSVNRQRVTSMDEFRQLVSGASQLLFSVQRGPRVFFLAIR
ncbi:MAG: DegQ family serine endoprotease [Arenicellales bacterium]